MSFSAVLVTDLEVGAGGGSRLIVKVSSSMLSASSIGSVRCRCCAATSPYCRPRGQLVVEFGQDAGDVIICRHLFVVRAAHVGIVRPRRPSSATHEAMSSSVNSVSRPMVSAVRPAVCLVDRGVEQGGHAARHKRSA